MSRIIDKLMESMADKFGISSSENMFEEDDFDNKPEQDTKADKESPKMMEGLIQMINKLQNIFSLLSLSDPINLPQIVMVGTQSTGKSSTLESIVRHSFLPRGSGIVTRCPLVIQLNHCPNNDKKYRKDGDKTTMMEEWATFSHSPMIFSDFEDIRKEIENRTNKIAKGTKTISRETINLSIFSPKVVNLTLVDLPGLTKVAVDDQPEDIEEQIEKLVMEYAQNPNSIILAVSTAEIDLAASESLKMAKKVDPKGERTLAILTKLDRIKNFGDGVKNLTGKSGVQVPLKLGIIGVVNRFQDDVSIEQQIEIEKKFLEKNFPDIAEFNGIPYLEKSLSDLLMKHIQKDLPNLKERIAKKLKECEEIVQACGIKVTDKYGTLSMSIANFSKQFEKLINGRSRADGAIALIGGPAIRKVFDEKFPKELQAIEPQISKEDIIECMKSTGGPRGTIFANEIIFEDMVKIEIERLRGPALNCADDIRTEMEKVIKYQVEKQVEAVRFPKLMQKIKAVMMNFLEERMPHTLGNLKMIIEAELSCINTLNPDFSIQTAFAECNSQMGNGDSNECYEQFKARKDAVDAKIIEILVRKYFNLEKKKIGDSVPKIIMQDLINYMKDNTQMELLTKLHQQVDLLAESEGITKKRMEAFYMLKALRKANEIINDVDDTYG